MRWAVLAACGATAGCALLSGLGDVTVCATDCADGSADTGAGLDATPDTGPTKDAAPPVSCPTPPGLCVESVPPGWTLVTTGVTCPANFVAGTFVTGATAPQNACECSCTVATPPSCPGTVPYGIDIGCAPNGNTSVGQCMRHYGWVALTAPTPVGGTCSPASAPVLGPDKTTTASCAPPVACQEDLCAGRLPGLAACIVHEGVEPCPGGFTKRTPVYADATIACDATQCVCSISVGTCTVTASDYSLSNCTSPVQALTVDGQCHAVNGQSFKVDKISAMSPTCIAGGAAGATATLSGLKTLCCR